MTLVKDTFQLNEIRETVSKGEFLPKPVLIIPVEGGVLRYKEDM